MTFRTPLPIKRKRPEEEKTANPNLDNISPNSKMVISALNSLQNNESATPAPATSFNPATQLSVRRLSDRESRDLSLRKRGKKSHTIRINTQNLFPNNQPWSVTETPVERVIELPFHLEGLRPRFEKLFATPNPRNNTKPGNHIPAGKNYFK